MAGMLDLGDVFELIGDGLDHRAFAQKELVGPVEQTVVHLFTQLGDELKPLSDQQLLGQGLGEIAFVPKSLPTRPVASLGTGCRSSTLPGVKQNAGSRPDH